MLPESRKLLADMQDAARKIVRFTEGKTLDAYRLDEQLQWSVERGFEIVGEALGQLHKLDAPTAEKISDWRAIISFRNVLIHGYSAVNRDTTWDVVQTELPLLLRELDALLADSTPAHQ